MPIEIAILSGTRQGERLEFDAATLRVGDEPSCEVYFNADHDHAVKGRHLVLRRTEDGWQLTNEGRESIWVNHEPISTSGAIRSGDIVRLSELGPDFSFTILSGPSQLATASKDSAAPQEKASTSADKQSDPAAPPSKPVSELASTASLNSGKQEGRLVTESATSAVAKEQEQAEKPSVTAPAPINSRTAIAIAVSALLVVAAFAWLLVPVDTRPPKLPEFGEKTVKEGDVFTLSARVIDPGEPVGTLRYSLLAGDEYGIQIDPATGDINWATTEEHGPGKYEVTVKVLAASQDHQASDEKTFALNVLEVNQPPRFMQIPQQTIHLHQDISLNIELKVNDPDEPTNRLKLALGSDTPKGVKLNAQTGKILWRPTPDQAGVHTLTVRVSDDGPQPLTHETSFKVEVIKPDPWALAEDQARRWTVLLIGEAPDTGEIFPFGTGMVFDRQAVVTNGVLAAELAKRTRRGWKVHVFHPADQQKFLATRILVHNAFELSKDQPAEQIYFDFGIVEVAEPFADVGQLASPSALASLERGQTVACVAIPHGGQPLTRFSQPAAEFAKSKIYLITQLSAGKDNPGAPRLLHLAGKLPRNIYGSPVINVDGQIVGIYAERAAKPADGDAAATDDLHYAASPSLVDAWRKGQGTEGWKAPAVEEPAKESETGENKENKKNTPSGEN